MDQKENHYIHSSWVISLFALFVLMGCGQNEKMAKDETSTVSMEQGQDPLTTDEVQRAVAAFNKAMVDPSAELMEILCAEELTYGHSSGLIQDRAAFIDDAGESVDIRIGNVQVYQKGKDGRLRLLARQAYKLPK